MNDGLTFNGFNSTSNCTIGGYPNIYTYPTTTITISTTVTLYAKCGHCAKTEPSTGYLPAGWLSLECGGVKQSLCSMKCVAEYAKAASKK